MSWHMQTVAGCGELVYDHVFVKNAEEGLTYLGSRGGGSVWNILADLAVHGVPTRGIGVGGDDVQGRLALMELRQLGVDVTMLRLRAGKRTRIIFQTLMPSAHPRSVPRHVFRGRRCLVCDSHLDDARLARFGSPAPLTEPLGLELDALCADRLTKDRMHLMQHSKAHGALTVLDLGRTGHLRYVPAASVLGHLDHFDIVAVPESVISSFVRRGRLASVADIVAAGEVKILCVTRAIKGVRIYAKDAAARSCELDIAPLSFAGQVDSAGCGDAFLSRFLFRLLRSASSQGKRSALRDIAAIHATATEAVESLAGVLRACGARGHLPMARTGGVAGTLTGFRGMPLLAIRNATAQMAECPFCGTRTGKQTTASPVRRTVRAGIGANTALLLRRTFRSIERTIDIDKCRAFMRDVRTGYTVGTGGSYPAAFFIAQLMTQACKAVIYPMRPFDYAKTGAPSQCLVAVTYSGQTADCGMAIRRAIDLGVERIALVTGTKDPKLGRLLRPGRDVVVSCSDRAGERGFVSVAGTVAPCAVWTAAVVKPRDMIGLSLALEREGKSDGDEKVIRALASVAKAGVLDVFGSGWAWPAMLDLESKFVEGGLGAVQIHEAKDFSHGRFITVFRKDRASAAKVAIQVGAGNGYDSLLVDTLRRMCPLKLIQSECPGPLGALKTLIEVQFLVRQIASLLQIDISRPKLIPRRGLELYRWREVR